MFSKRLQQRCFPVNFEKFLRIPVLLNICERLFSECQVRQKRLSYVVEQLHHALCFTNFMKDCVSHLKTTQKHLKSNFLYSSQTHNYVIIVNILYICMFFYNSRKTPEQMAENWRKALMPNKKLHVLFVPKV